MAQHGVNAYLINTGWTGGGYGVGKRMSIKGTRACVNAILDGSINNSDFETMPYFNLSIPTSLEGVETSLLNPRNAWEDKASFDATAQKLAGMFVANFKKYTGANNDFDFTQAGPQI